MNYICQGTKERQERGGDEESEKRVTDRQGRGWGERGGGGGGEIMSEHDRRRAIASAKMANAQFDTCNEEERQHFGNITATGG